MEGEQNMTTLTLRDAWRPFAEFDGPFRSFGADVARPGFRPAAEVSRDGDDAVVRVELPGPHLAGRASVRPGGAAVWPRVGSRPCRCSQTSSPRSRNGSIRAGPSRGTRAA